MCAEVTVCNVSVNFLRHSVDEWQLSTGTATRAAGCKIRTLLQQLIILPKHRLLSAWLVTIHHTLTARTVLRNDHEHRCSQGAGAVFSNTGKSTIFI